MDSATGVGFSDHKTYRREQPIFNGTDLNGKPYFIYKGEEYSLWALSKKCPQGLKEGFYGRRRKS